MRIVAGSFRGRRLAAPRGLDVRPTSDRVREAVFSILGDMHGMIVLDMFAGTGAMGLEALSRGAAAATFVEIDRQALDVVRRNIAATVTDNPEAIEVIKGDASRVARTLALGDQHFDLIFYDPPYDSTRQLIADMADSVPPLASAGSRIVLEVSARHEDEIPLAAEAWGAEITMQRSYGDTSIAILQMP